MKKYNRMPLIVTSTGYYSFIPQIPGKSKHSMNKNQGPNIEIPSQQIIQPQGLGPQIPNQEIPQPPRTRSSNNTSTTRTRTSNLSI